VFLDEDDSTLYVSGPGKSDAEFEHLIYVADNILYKVTPPSDFVYT
jgi:hypothetical protein